MELTTSLFAPSGNRTGKVIGLRYRLHRVVEFLKLFEARPSDTIEAQVPADLDVNLIVDNYATHKTALNQKWFAKRSRFRVDFVSTVAFWLNLVERWFALFIHQQWRRGAHQCSSGLETTIYRYLAVANENPNPLPGPRPLIRYWPT